MYPCTCGETLTRSVHENAANRTAAMRTRTQVCERPELFISPEDCDNRKSSASHFLLGLRRLCTSKAMQGRIALPKLSRNGFGVSYISQAAPWECVRVLASLLWSSSGLVRRNNSRLERNTMVGSRVFRRCACSDLCRPFGVLVIWILI